MTSVATARLAARPKARAPRASKAPNDAPGRRPEADRRPAVVLYTGEFGRAPADVLTFAALARV